MYKPLFASSVLALSNLSSSNFLFANALITRSPVKLSLLTKFTLSSNSWNFLNLGDTNINDININKSTKLTAKTIIQDIGLLITLVIAPIPNIGANKTILKIIVTTLLIWVISFVHLVIKEALLKLFKSAVSKDIIFSTTFFLKSLLNKVLTLLETYTLNIVIPIASIATIIILIPVVLIYDIDILSISSPKSLYSFFKLLIISLLVVVL